MKGLQSAIFLFLLSMIVRHGEGYTLNDSMTLMNDMLSGYDRRHRPILNQSLPVWVNVSYELFLIQDLDEVTQQFSINGLLTLSWFDENLVWDPAKYGGIEEQMYPLSDIWFPKLVQAKAFGSQGSITNAASEMDAQVDYTGFVEIGISSVFHTTCHVDMTYYPFDTQKCRLQLVAAFTRIQDVKLYSTKSKVGLTYYTENGEWTIINRNVYAYIFNRFINFNIYVKRQPMFLLWNIFLPIVFMAFINIFVFLLPAEAGERVSYAITCLLSTAVFLTLINDNLPSTSDNMARISYYLASTLIVSVAVCILTIINLRIFHKSDKKPVSSWLKTMVKLVNLEFCKTESKRLTVTVHPAYDEKIKLEETNEKMDNGSFAHEQQARSYESDITWQDVSRAFDLIYLFAFMLIDILLTLCFILRLASNS